MKHIRFIALAVICFVIGGFFALVQTPAPQTGAAEQAKPAVAGVPIGGAFSLTDHKGNAVTEKSWPGKMTLVFFGFTNCPDICPTGLQKITTVMEAVDPKAEKVVPILITVDPARDTKEVMAAYVANFSPTIVGLTGTQAQIDQAVSAYKVYAAKEEEPAHEHGGDHHNHGAPQYTVNHSGYMYLMSPEGKLLEIFKTDETAEAMTAKIRLHTK